MGYITSFGFIQMLNSRLSNARMRQNIPTNSCMIVSAYAMIAGSRITGPLHAVVLAVCCTP